jgi:biofilm PGA synthesis N-glycosyltransferase PgaC
MKIQYVIITPVRDEEQYLESTINSILCQTIRPIEWVIVDDGSTDLTGEIIDRYASQHGWIRSVHRNNRGFRKSGCGVMEAFYEGYKSLIANNWDYIVKLDGDLSFAPDYIEKCLIHFHKDTRLGIGGGVICHNIDGKLKMEDTPRFHVRGASKIYKKECWEAIGGLWPAAGWDTIDEVKANMMGWKTYSFQDLLIKHHRFTGAADGLFRDRVKHGVACYISGYHPLYLVASCFLRLIKRPFIIGSIAIFYGYVKSFINRPGRMHDRKYCAYIRAQQLRRLCGMQTIWK